VRQHFFGKYPELLDQVSSMSDEEIWQLNRGGHDPVKVHAAYAAAVRHTGQPTVILAKTVKGYGMGEAGEGQNITHQQKKMAEAALRAFRDRFGLPIPDDRLLDYPYQRPAEDSPELRYLRERRAVLGGYLPARRTRSTPLPIPPLSAFKAQLAGTEGRQISTTMAFVRVLTTLLRDKQIGKRVVRSSPTSRARSAWRACSGSSASSPSSASSTSRRTPTSSCTTARTAAGRSSRRASTSRARCRRGSPRRPPTAPATRR
jgi:pyruvate dehydrogenase E1 component